MFCSSCGTQLPSNAVYCLQCGTRVPGGDDAAKARALADLMADRDGNGIPDVLERMAERRAAGGISAGEAGSALDGLPLAGGGFREAPRVDLSAIPPAPRTPSKRAKDLVFGYQGGQLALLIIGIAFTAMGSLFAVIFCWGLPVDLALAISGERVTGTVVGTSVQTNVSINDAHPTLVRYKYRVGGESYDGESSTLDVRVLIAAKPGAPVPLEVLPSAPGLSRIEGSTFSTFGYATSFVLIFPIVGAALFFFAVRSNRREIRAFVHGVPTVARVAYLGPDTSTRINGRHPTKLEWSFEVDGQSFKGSISHMDPGRIVGLASGRELIVLRDAKDPRVSTVWVS